MGATSMKRAHKVLETQSETQETPIDCWDRLDKDPYFRQMAVCQHCWLAETPVNEQVCGGKTGVCAYGWETPRGHCPLCECVKEGRPVGDEQCICFGGPDGRSPYVTIHVGGKDDKDCIVGVDLPMIHRFNEEVLEVFTPPAKCMPRRSFLCLEPITDENGTVLRFRLIFSEPTVSPYTLRHTAVNRECTRVCDFEPKKSREDIKDRYMLTMDGCGVMQIEITQTNAFDLDHKRQPDPPAMLATVKSTERAAAP